MKKMGKRILSVLAAVLLLGGLLCGCSEEGFPTATERFFVNDFADVITSADEDGMYNLAVALNNSTTAQVVVVTVESLDGMEPYEYALELGREWGVGTEEKDNGIVVLFSEGDREIYIAVGYGLEGALPDSKTGRIIDVYGLDYLRNDEFSKGLSAIQKALVNEVYIEYGMEPQEGYIAIDKLPADVSDEDAGDVLMAWIIMVIIIIILLSIFRRGNRGFMWFGGPHIHMGGFSGGSSGGFGGFSGGGGFRGGGGSFGGGGAGRGF